MPAPKLQETLVTVASPFSVIGSLHINSSIDGHVCIPWSVLCTDGALDRAKSCRNTFQSAGRGTSLHMGEKEENKGHKH